MVLLEKYPRAIEEQRKILNKHTKEPKKATD